MRNIAKMLVVACISFALAGMLTFQSLALDPKTVAGMWLFDEGRGDVAKDSSGNGNDGKLMEPEWVDGKIGKALEFNGAGDYIDCGKCPSLDLTDQITFVVWVKHPKGTEGYVIIKNTPDDAIRQYGFLDYVSEGTISFFCNTDVGREGLNWAGNIDDDTWRHIALTINNPDVELFIDGVSEGTMKLGGDIVSEDATVWIGKRKPNNFAYTGLIDELAVFNVVLSLNDINRIMDEGLSKVRLAVSSAGKLATAWAAVKNQR